MIKYIYILFFILLKVAYINAANKIVVSNSSKLKGVSVNTYSSYGVTSPTFDVLNIANPELGTSWNDLDEFTIDQQGIYINNEVKERSNIPIEGTAIRGSLDNYADTIVINVTQPATTSIWGNITVLGKQANLVIQNKNGPIDCFRCSFGNVNILTLQAQFMGLSKASLSQNTLKVITDYSTLIVESNIASKDLNFNIMGDLMVSDSKFINLQNGLFNVGGNFFSVNAEYFASESIYSKFDIRVKEKLSLQNKTKFIFDDLSFNAGDFFAENSQFRIQQFLIEAGATINFSQGNSFIDTNKINFNAENGSVIMDNVSFETNSESNLLVNFHVNAYNINIKTYSLKLQNPKLVATEHILINSSENLFISDGEIRANVFEIQSKNLNITNSELPIRHRFIILNQDTMYINGSNIGAFGNTLVFNVLSSILPSSESNLHIDNTKFYTKILDINYNEIYINKNSDIVSTETLNLLSKLRTIIKISKLKGSNILLFSEQGNVSLVNVDLDVSNVLTLKATLPIFLQDIVINERNTSLFKTRIQTNVLYFYGDGRYASAINQMKNNLTSDSYFLEAPR